MCHQCAVLLNFNSTGLATLHDSAWSMQQRPSSILLFGHTPIIAILFWLASPTMNSSNCNQSKIPWSALSPDATNTITSSPFSLTFVGCQSDQESSLRFWSSHKRPWIISPDHIHLPLSATTPQSEVCVPHPNQLYPYPSTEQSLMVPGHCCLCPHLL